MKSSAMASQISLGGIKFHIGYSFPWPENGERPTFFYEKVDSNLENLSSNLDSDNLTKLPEKLRMSLNEKEKVDLNKVKVHSR